MSGASYIAVDIRQLAKIFNTHLETNFSMSLDPFSQYVSALDGLLDHQSQYVAKLNNGLLQDYHIRYRSERAMFRQFTVELQKFGKLARQRMEQFAKTGDPANLRVCMLLNQYVFGDDRVRDAVGLAREGAKTDGRELPMLVVGSIQQLKTDLVKVKGFLEAKGEANEAKSGYGVEELEHFAANMALIKVNYMLTNEVESVQPIGRVYDFENTVESPNDTKLTNTKLWVRGSGVKDGGDKGDKGGGDKGDKGDNGERAKDDKSDKDGKSGSASKSDKYDNTDSSSKISSLDRTHEYWRQFDCLRSQVKRLVCAFAELETALVQFMDTGHQCRNYWWKMLGNNHYDYGLRCYLEKWESHTESVENVLEYVRSAKLRWTAVESAMAPGVRRSVTKLSRHFLNYKSGIFQDSTTITQNHTDEKNHTSHSNPTNHTNHTTSHTARSTFLPPSQITDISNFRTVLLAAVHLEIAACVDNHASLANQLSLRTKSGEPEWPAYTQIVREYQASMAFTVALMELPDQA